MAGPIERYIDGGNQATKDVFHCSAKALHSSIDIDSPKTENAPLPGGEDCKVYEPKSLEQDSV